MNRIALAALLALSVLIAGSASAGEAPPAGDPPAVVEVKAPCLELANPEALAACLQEVVDQGKKILLPTCQEEGGTPLTEEELAECQARIAAYQKAVAKITGEPCYGLMAEALTTCTEAVAAQADGDNKKKGGLTKHEGTKMERMSDESLEE